MPVPGETCSQYVQASSAILPGVVNKLVSLPSYKSVVEEHLTSIYEVVSTGYKRKEAEGNQRKKDENELDHAGASDVEESDVDEVGEVDEDEEISYETI